MEIKDNKIVKITNEELFDYWLNRYDNMLSYDDFKTGVINQGTIIESNGEENKTTVSEDNDNVNHPKHYNVGNIEVIHYIEDKLSYEEFTGYLTGNLIKYISRYKYKNGLEDLKKAQWYLNYLISYIES